MKLLSRAAVVLAWLSVTTVLVEGCSGDVSTPSGATAPTTVSYTIPQGGGSIDVGTPSGNKISFDFPASAAGKAITLTASDAASIGWSAADFHDVIKMEPDGTQFADPVTVHGSTGGIVVGTVPTSSTKTAPSLLPLAPSGKGALLTHFSTLVIANVACEYKAAASSPPCGQFAPATTQLDLACPMFCSLVTASCCADPNGNSTCQFGNPGLAYQLSALPSSTAPAYCGLDASVADSSVSDATLQDSTVADAPDESSTEGGVCSVPQCQGNDTQSCTCQRSDGTTTYAMVCDQIGHVCSCEANGRTYLTFSQTVSCLASDTSGAAYYMNKACACPYTPADAGGSDTGATDSSVTDTGASDSSTTDGGTDAGATETGATDTGVSDAVADDASSADAGTAFATGSNICDLATDGTYLYVGHCKGGGLYRYVVSGTDAGTSTALVAGANTATDGIAVDSNNVYWCDGGSTAIMKSMLNQVSQFGIVVATRVTSCSHPVSDGTNVYWIDGSSILYAPIVGGDGGTGTVLVSGQTGISSLAYDPANGYLYWNAGDVYRAPATGSDAGAVEDYRTLNTAISANVSYVSGFLGFSTATNTYVLDAVSGGTVQSLSASSVGYLAIGGTYVVYTETTGLFSTYGGTAHAISSTTGMFPVIIGTTVYWRDNGATSIYSASVL
jgi:hypothetical protein